MKVSWSETRGILYSLNLGPTENIHTVAALLCDQAMELHKVYKPAVKPSHISFI